MTCTNQIDIDGPVIRYGASDAFLSYADGIEKDGLSLTALFKRWHFRWQSRRQLEQMSREMLADIGLTEGSAYREYTKPFWR